MHGFKGVLCHQSESDYSQENHTLSSSFRPSAGPEQESVFWDLGVGLKVEVSVCIVHGRQSYPKGDIHIYRLAPRVTGGNCCKEGRVPGKHLIV